MYKATIFRLKERFLAETQGIRSKRRTGDFEMALGLWCRSLWCNGETSTVISNETYCVDV